MEQNQSKFAVIYDRLNSQPDLQEIIKEKYYDTVLRENREKQQENHREVVDILNYSFSNVRQHQLALSNQVNENEIIVFLKEGGHYYEVIGPNKLYGYRRAIEQFYGDDWEDYFEYEYGDYNAVNGDDY
tara:strand:+ start:106 stop:492 length:387 start_codon:yes stop_codon:yes gene_type:complete